MKYKNGKPLLMNQLNRTISWRKKTLSERREGINVTNVGKREMCPICNHYESKPFIDMYNSNTYYIECLKCGHLYLEDIASDESIKEIYNDDTAYLNLYVDEEVFQKRVDMIAAPKVEFIKKNIPHALSKEWLDIGCGGCDLLVAAKQANFNVRGVEAGSLGLKQGKRYDIKIEQAFITKQNVEKFLGNAQIISLLCVLEHISDPKALLKIIKNATVQDSFFVIELPRHPSLSALTATMFNDKVVRQLITPDHIHIFTEKSVEIFLEQCGLKIDIMWRYGQDFYELLSMITQNADKEIDSWPAELFNSINDVQKVLDEHGLSDSMLIIASSINCE